MSIERNTTKEFEAITKAYEKSGGDVSGLLQKDIVSIIVSGNEIIGRNTVDGVKIDADISEGKVKMNFQMMDNTVLKKPVHLCVGYLKDFGEQNLEMNFDIGNNCKANFVSHCTFPAAKEFMHNMKANINIGENSKINYVDTHMHNEEGWVNLDAKYFAIIGNNSSFDNRFALTKTRVGHLKITMDVDVMDNAKAYIESKVKSKKDDKVEIKEILKLKGKESSGIAKTYIIASDQSYAKVINEAYGLGDNSTGHIECDEIIVGSGVDVSTIPLLNVTNETSELTHEASVGRINSEQLETLMCKGLTEEEATELIIKGIFS